MKNIIFLIWNVFCLFICMIEAIRFDYYHFKRLGWAIFSFKKEKWNFSDLERKSIRRFLTIVSIDLAGNALILGIFFLLKFIE